MYSSLVSVLTAKPWPSASKVIGILGITRAFDWRFSTVAACVGVCQHKQLQRQCDSDIVSATLALLARFSTSAAQGLHAYTFVSFKMSLCLGDVPSLSRLSAQVDASALDEERDAGFFSAWG